MTMEQQDSGWPRLLSLAVHEVRTPISVAAGYIRMILTGRAGDVTEAQRHMLEEAEKACGRLSALVAEMSDLSNLEAGTAQSNRSPVDLRTVLADAVATLPQIPDRHVEVKLTTGSGPAAIQGDAGRLKTAFTAILNAAR